MNKPARADRPNSPSWRLGELLVQRGLVTEDDVLAAIEAQSLEDRYLGDILVEHGALDETTLYWPWPSGPASPSCGWSRATRTPTSPGSCRSP